MTKEKELLLSEFIKLAKKGYVKGVNNITNSVGLTFESQLGKKPDSDYLPDYNGIELKCTTRLVGTQYHYFQNHLMDQTTLK